MNGKDDLTTSKSDFVDPLAVLERKGEFMDWQLSIRRV